ncbi:MAG TPA: TlpA disulfide reductase family protein [Cyclobacteriaceae bacterium]|nr:TlpA disulfide reductase family protein [Cyclobacteriaceae bacterium]
MKKSPASFFLLFFWSTILFAQSDTTAIIRLRDLREIIQEPHGKIRVINFWATWCAPCIKELPLLEKLNEKTDVNVILVSMDLDLDPNPEKVYKFVQRRQIRSRVLILNEKDPNSWIDQIDGEWSGALPATLIINPETGQRKFIEKELHPGELEDLIEELL